MSSPGLSLGCLLGEGERLLSLAVCERPPVLSDEDYRIPQSSVVRQIPLVVVLSGLIGSDSVTALVVCGSKFHLQSAGVTWAHELALGTQYSTARKKGRGRSALSFLFSAVGTTGANGI